MPPRSRPCARPSTTLEIDGTVVIGEGERDEAPMLYIGEKVGGAPARAPRSTSRSIRSKAPPSPPRRAQRARRARLPRKGCLLNAPDTYMDKLAVGPGYPEGIIDLAKSPSDNVRAVAKAKGVEPSRSSSACSTGRAMDLIAELRGLGCGVVLIADGDVAGVIAVTDEDTTIDMYMGQGGAPEGVLAAAALRCVGGQFKGRLVFRNEDEKARARKWGIPTTSSTASTGSRRAGAAATASSPPPASPTGSLLGGRQAPPRRPDDHRERRHARLAAGPSAGFKRRASGEIAG